MSAAGIAAVTGGRVVGGDPQTRIDRISIDSRTVSPGDFFIAIRGERFDGHRFVAEALRRGAIGALVDSAGALDGVKPFRVESPEVMPATEAGNRRPSPVVVHVDDSTRALQQIAREMRRRSGARVVAITGSAGKTTTKEIAAEFLCARYRVFKNKGNLNNHIGLPLSLLELRSRPEIAVVELGMNHPGEIRTLVDIAEPDVRVWTNVGDAHLGFFESADAMADAKAEIVEAARPSDLLIVNANDPRVMARAGEFPGRVVAFGIETAADIRATGVEIHGLDGSTARLSTPAGEARIATPLLGLGNLANVLAAASIALHFDIALDEIVARAARARAAHHRGELLRLPGGVTLIDDSYNSSPSALKLTLQVIGAATGCARKIAVLGEMLELGGHAERLHHEAGMAAAAAGLDWLVTVGGTPARALADSAIASGMSGSSVSHVASKEQAAEQALALVRPGDIVLVKGSRGIGTDLVVERLKEEFA